MSAKINLQYLISLFELHRSHEAAASNQDSVNIQRVAFYYLRLYIFFYFILKYYVHVRLGDIEEEGRMKDKCEEERKDTAARLVRLNEFQSDKCQYEKGSLWIPQSIKRYWRSCKYLCCATLLFINFVTHCTAKSILDFWRGANKGL